ncbi:hypothetical protein BT93_F2444 [Corymbia citriodora subsp. variegata]|nr:hypothetical protein BT93_F2444 [Corymbia citriodora subsp. variegata]
MNRQEEETPEPAKGGLITMPFIIANEAFEKVASYGLLPNMILYLMRDYHFGVAKGTNLIFFWSAATNFVPLLGAFIADSYLGRFLTIALGSISSLSGMTLLWLTAMIPRARPPPCDPSTNTCESSSTPQMILLILAFALISIGAGGIRPCSLAFGADQLDRKENPNNKRVLESYFNWYYASAFLSVLVALTGIVYTQDHLGWKVGFGIPAILMFFSAFLFVLASPYYIKQKANKSLFTGFAQVIAVAYKNRKLDFPSQGLDGFRRYHQKKGLESVLPTNKLRFLNKACIIKDPENDITPDGMASNPWSLCTVQQVEELKALIKVVPLWSTGIMLSINVSQTSFPLLQASSMDRHITSSFQIPAGSFGTFTIITLSIWVILYDRVVLPLASKVRGKPVRLGVKLRMGIGLLLSCMAMVVSAIVEHVRRNRALQEGLREDPHAVVRMSAMWLVPQYCLNGFAEAFVAIGQTEFYYSEFPRSMSSIAASLFGLGMAVANLLASAIVTAVDGLTSGRTRTSWVSSNINEGRYDNYYWLLAIMSLVNVFYFLFCSWIYGPCASSSMNVQEQQIGSGKELEVCKIEKKLKDELDEREEGKNDPDLKK